MRRRDRGVGRLSLRSTLALAFGLSSVALTLAISILVGQLATAELQRTAKRDLAEVAFNMKALLDRSMFGRVRDIQVAASLSEVRDPTATPETRRRVVQQLKDTYPYYAWIGFVHLDGTVSASTDGLLEGANAAARPIFQGGLKGPYVGDVHEAVMLAKLLPAPSDEPLRFVDVATPVYAPDGTPIGVLAAHVGWHWATEIARTILARPASKDIELLVLSRDGHVLLGPPPLRGTFFGQPEDTGLDGATAGKDPSGADYVSAVSVSTGHHSFPGLGWRIVARQNMANLAEPVAALQRQIWLWGGGIGLLFVLGGVAMAEAITRPLRRLTAAADDLRLGKAAAFDVSAHSALAEVASVSTAIGDLVGNLHAKERSLAEANLALGETAERLATLVHSAPLAIVAIDPEGRVGVWNPAAEEMFGYTAPKVKGTAFPAVPPDRSEQFHATLARVMGGERIKDIRSRYRRKDGSDIDVSIWVSPLRDGTGAVYGTLGLIKDVTEDLKVQEQLRQSQKMEAVGQLTGGLAHDFNNILGVVLGNLDLLGEALEQDSEKMELVEAAVGAVLRGSDLTRSLLAFSRRQPLNPMPTDVGSLLTQLSRLLERGLGERIRFKVRADDGLWPVHVDAVQLDTAITNLAVNARDAMPNGGTILLEARNVVLDEDYIAANPEAPEGDCVMIAVSDQGTGMTAAVVAQIFEPFFTTKPKDKGTGLGLSMVYGFVKQSGGHVKVYSEVGRGTSVRIYLPRHYGKAEERQSPEVGVLPTGTETVLVVEDNEAMREIVLRQLAGLGYRTIEARNGEEGLHAVQSSTDLDVVLTDIVMGDGMDGFELARRVRALMPDLPVVLTSGFPGSDDGSVADACPAIASGFLTKPYRRDELARVIRQSIDKRRASCVETAC